MKYIARCCADGKTLREQHKALHTNRARPHTAPAPAKTLMQQSLLDGDARQARPMYDYYRL
jgi:hypothetical protein